MESVEQVASGWGRPGRDPSGPASSGAAAAGRLGPSEAGMPIQVLLIDDDRKLTDRMKEYLASHDMTVTVAGDGATGLNLLGGRAVDVVLLDVMLPGLDGFEICRAIRKTSRVPIIMLTARGEEADRIVGLELGADDYLAKPFSPRELVARVRAILRRMGPDPEAEPLVFGRVRIDPGAREVTVAGEPVELTAYQFDLLHTLASRPGRVYGREELSELTRGSGLGIGDRSIDVHISRIRALIETDPRKPRYIKTIRSAGYMFVKDPGDEA